MLRSWPQVCLSLRSTCKVSQKCRRECHCSIGEKGTVSEAKSLFVGSLEISSKKSSHWKNAENFCRKNSNGPRLCRYPGRGVLLYVGYIGMYFCSPKEYGFLIEPLLKTIIRFCPSFRKNIQHFHWISFLDLTLPTETNDDHWKLKEKHPREGFYRPLVRIHSNFRNPISSRTKDPLSAE